MKRFVARTAIGVLLALACSSSLLLAQNASQAGSEGDTANWSVAYPLFGWVPLFGFAATTPPASPCAGCPPDTPSGSGNSSGISGAWLAALRLETGRFEASIDFNYAGLTARRERPFFHADATLKTAAVLGGVRVFGPLFVEAGARYHGVDFTIDILTFSQVKWSPGRWAPAIGLTFRPALAKSLRLYTHVDWGGLGVHDITTVNGAARVEWRPWTHLAVTGGWGFMKATLDGQILNRPIHVSETVNGPVLGVGIPF